MEKDDDSDISKDSLEDEDPIRLMASDCKALFTKVSASTTGSSSLQDFAAYIENQQQCFEGWCIFLRVFSPAQGSLDDRLRQHPSLLDAIIRLLDMLRKNLAVVSQKLSKIATSLHDDPTKISTEFRSMKKGIEECIQRLNKIGLMIRSSGKSTLVARARRFASTNPSIVRLRDYEDRAYLALHSLYPNAAETLRQHLVSSMVDRYARVSYEAARAGKYTIQGPSGGNFESAQAVKSIPASTSSSSTGDRTTKRVSVSEIHIPTSSIDTAIVPKIVQRAEHIGLVESRAPRTLTRHNEGLREPDPPALEKGETSIYCKWCFRVIEPSLLEIRPNSGRMAWSDEGRRHYRQDLQPYVCLANECYRSRPTFSSTRDWLEHINSKHSQTWFAEMYNLEMWSCSSHHENDTSYSYSNREDLKHHIDIHHRDDEHQLGEFEQDQKMLSLQSKTIRKASVCLLCSFAVNAGTNLDEHGQASRDKVVSREMATHLAEHLHHIMMVSLQVMDALESTNSLDNDIGSNFGSDSVSSGLSAHAIEARLDELSEAEQESINWSEYDERMTHLRKDIDEDDDEVDDEADEEKRMRENKAREPVPPKKPLTATFLFAQSARPTVKTDLEAQLPPGEVLQNHAIQNEINKRWNEMAEEEKELWRGAYRESMERYKVELAAHISRLANYRKIMAKEKEKEEAISGQETSPLHRSEGMRLLRAAIQSSSDWRDFRVPEATKVASFACEWGAREDGMLCVGIDRYGFGAWSQIRDDPDLRMYDKMLFLPPLEPDAEQLAQRATYLLSVLVARDTGSQMGHNQGDTRTTLESEADAASRVHSGNANTSVAQDTQSHKDTMSKTTQLLESTPIQDTIPAHNGDQDSTQLPGITQGAEAVQSPQWSAYYQRWITPVWDHKYQRWYWMHYIEGEGWVFLDWAAADHTSQSPTQYPQQQQYEPQYQEQEQYQPQNQPQYQRTSSYQPWTGASAPDDGGPQYEALEPTYYVRGKDFFIPGRAIAVLFTEPISTLYNAAQNYRAASPVRFGEPVRTQIRRCIVVRQKEEFCFAIPIFTYGQKGTTKHGVVPGEHAIAYSCGNPPQLVEGEQNLTKEPIGIIMAPGERPLHVASRIYFGMHHPIQYNVKVKHVGTVRPDDRDKLLAYWTMEQNAE